MKFDGKLIRIGIVVFLVAMGLSFLTNRLIRVHVPQGVQFVSTSDPELDNAIATAQEGLPQFEAQFEKAGKNHFAVKVRFFATDDPRKDEMMWVDHLKKSGKNWTGTLADRPIVLTTLHRGDQVEFQTSQIVDWEVIYPDGTHDGAFTDDVLMREGKKVTDGY